MPTPVKENKKRYEQHRSMFYSYCLMSIGVNPDASQELIEELMEENGYAIGTSEDGTVISFGKKLNEPTPEGESYEILASANLYGLDLGTQMVKANALTEALSSSAAYQYAKLLNDLELWDDLFDYPQEGDMANDNCVCFFCDGYSLVAYGATNKDTTRVVSNEECKLFIDNHTCQVVTLDQVNKYSELQKRFNLPPRSFTTVFIDGENEADVKGLNFVFQPFHKNRGIVMQMDRLYPDV